MRGFQRKQIGGRMHGMETPTHPKQHILHPWHASKCGNWSPSSIFFRHFDLLVTSSFPGLFSPSTKASSPSLTVRSLQGLFTQGHLAQAQQQPKGERGGWIWSKGQKHGSEVQSGQVQGRLLSRMGPPGWWHSRKFWPAQGKREYRSSSFRVGTPLT